MSRRLAVRMSDESYEGNEYEEEHQWAVLPLTCSVHAVGGGILLTIN